MVRKLSLAVSLALGAASFNAVALGLGGIQARSALYEAFDGEIELLAVKKGEIDGVRVQLASPEAYEKAGVERTYLLSKLKFEPTRKSNGSAVIRVTSREPIREPFLNFLIELNWPEGRMIREYTVLLDPPASQRQSAGAFQPATVGGPVVGMREPIVTPMQGRTGEPGGAPGIHPTAAGPGQYGPVQQQETLWSIAMRHKYPRAEMSQMVIAIKRANPGAFVDGNINNMRKGVVLNIPPEADVIKVNSQQALAEYKQQLNNWQPTTTTAREAPRPKPKAAQAAAPATAKAAPAGGELEIVPPARKSTESRGDIQRLEQELAVAQEAAEAAQRENDELRGRLSQLESQIQDMQQLLSLKDEQLGQLQSQAAPAPAQPPQQQPTAPAQPKPEPAVAAQPKPAPAEQPKPEPAAKPTPPKPEPPAPAAQPEPKPEPKPAPAQQPKPTPKPEPTPAPQEKGIVDMLLDNILLIGGGLGGLALLGGGVYFIRRRKSGAEGSSEPESILMSDHGESELASEENPLSGLTTEETSFLDSLSSTGNFSEETELDDGDETSFLSDFVPSDIEALQEETGEVDPLAEADVYIAYGRFKQAEELVRQAMERDPGKSEFRFKLFEVLHAAKDSAGFSKLLAESSSMGLDESSPNEWKRVLDMDSQLAAGGGGPSGGDEDELDFDALAAMDEPTAETASADQGDDEVDLDFSSLGLDGDTEPAQSGDDTPVGGDEEDDFAGLDLTGLVGEETKAAAQQPAAPADESEDLDFDLDFSEETTVTPSDSGGEEEEFALDLGEAGDEGEGSGIPDLGSELIEEGDEGEDLEITGMNKREDSADELNFDIDTGLGGGEAAGDVDPEEVATKLDLARAYIDMGDEEGARDILNEVVVEGTAEQKSDAQGLLTQLG